MCNREIAEAENDVRLAKCFVDYGEEKCSLGLESKDSRTC